jgi:hypothetical protein
MSTIALHPSGQNLRQLLVGMIESAPEEQLQELHTRLLIAERDRLWKEIQVQAEADDAAGKFENVPEMIREFRMRNRVS